MNTFFALVVFVSFISFIVGMFNPKLVIKWGVDKKKNRKNVLKYYGLAIIIFGTLFGATSPKTESTDKSFVATNGQGSKVEQNSVNNEETKKKAEEKARAEAEIKAKAEAKAKVEAEAKAKEKIIAEADEYFNKAEDLMMKNGDFGKAIECYNKSIEINPNNSKYYSSGYYYAKFMLMSIEDSKNYSKQIQYINKAIELDPNNAKYYMDKAFALNEFKKYDEALITIDKGIELEQDNSFGYRTKADILYNLRRYDLALNVCDTAIEIDPNNEVGYLLKGKILQTLGMFSEQIACYKEMAERFPEKQKFYEGVEKAYRKAGKIQ